MNHPIKESETNMLLFLTAFNYKVGKCQKICLSLLYCNLEHHEVKIMLTSSGLQHINPLKIGVSVNFSTVLSKYCTHVRIVDLSKRATPP